MPLGGVLGSIVAYHSMECGSTMPEHQQMVVLAPRAYSAMLWWRQHPHDMPVRSCFGRGGRRHRRRRMQRLPKGSP